MINEVFYGSYQGDIRIESGEIIVGDPGYYSYNDWLQYLHGVKNGKWTCYVVESDQGKWGVRVAEIKAYYHNDPRYLSDSITKWEYIGVIGVDSGMAGIYDSEYFKRYHNPKTNEEWYLNTVCSSVEYDPKEECNLHFIPENAIITNSGFGDGEYGVYCKYDDENNVVAVKIEFIDIDEENDDK